MPPFLRSVLRLRRLGLVASALTSAIHGGTCPICAKRTVFVKGGHWLRDRYYCARCASVPRARALFHVLERDFPQWRELKIHESSPAGAGSARLARECPGYVGTHLVDGTTHGQMADGRRCEDLQEQTFADGSFDLVVTQDVFEHVLVPERGFREVARTLKPGGTHLFTVPWHYWTPTVVRAQMSEGRLVHLQRPEYHDNPIDRGGSLVVTDWGADLLEFIERCSGLRTTVSLLSDPRQGIGGDFREVFVSRKPA